MLHISAHVLIAWFLGINFLVHHASAIPPMVSNFVVRMLSYMPPQALAHFRLQTSSLPLPSKL